MFIPGVLMPLIALLGLYLVLRNRLQRAPWYLRLLPLAIPLPYIANTGGWVLTEVGRQPWIVFGIMRTEQGVSTAVSAGTMLASLVLLTVVYGSLMVADAYLLQKFARRGITAEEDESEELALAV
jgi:cytochrome bd ubiquinol oxidase subunit I